MSNNTLEHDKEIIYTADLQPVLTRLVQIEKWSNKDALEAIKQYRNYLFLRRKYPGQNLPPSRDVDEAWHAHVLHTKDYRAFCKLAFSHEEDQYLDHHPHLAKEGSLEKLSGFFEKTQTLYCAEFGEYMYKIQSTNFVEKTLNSLRDGLLAAFPKLADFAKS